LRGERKAGNPQQNEMEEGRREKGGPREEKGGVFDVEIKIERT
jgi:hypothetical protein